MTERLVAEKARPRAARRRPDEAPRGDDCSEADPCEALVATVRVAEKKKEKAFHSRNTTREAHRYDHRLCAHSKSLVSRSKRASSSREKPTLERLRATRSECASVLRTSQARPQTTAQLPAETLSSDPAERLRRVRELRRATTSDDRSAPPAVSSDVGFYVWRLRVV